MTALLRAAAAVLVSIALSAAAVFIDRRLEGGAAQASSPDAPDISLSDFADAHGARAAHLEAIGAACGGAFALRTAGVAGVEHVVAVFLEPGSNRLRRLSAPGDLMSIEPAEGAVRLVSPDGFHGLSWPVSDTGLAESAPARPREVLELPCADPRGALARFEASA